MDILDVVLGGILGFTLVAILPNNLISWKISFKKNQAKHKKI